MGWSSWNAFATLVDEEKVLGTAHALVETGLSELGYRYVNIDDGWWLKRRVSDGRLIIRTAIFPSAATGPDTSFKPFTDKLHKLGLKAGIYTDIGCNACSQAYDPHSPNLPEGSCAEREVGLMNHVTQDIDLFFREWGFDYLKVDACGLDSFGPDREAVLKRDFRMVTPLIDRNSINRTEVVKVRALCDEVSVALHKSNPNGDYVYSICNWGAANVRAWGKDVGNVVRVSDDIRPTWTRMLHNFDAAASRPLYAQPGAWNDPDMLFVGHGDFDEHHLTEAKSHFSLWAVINAPLLIGFDMRTAPKSLLEIWGNADLIAANQDPGGHQGVIAYNSDDVQIIVKTLADPRKQVVAILNRGLATADVALLPAHLKLAAEQPLTLRNLWTKEVVGPYVGERVFEVQPRETLVFEVQGTRALSNGMYLSQLPGKVNIAIDGVIVPETDPLPHRMLNPWNGTRSSGTRPTYGGWGGAQADATPYGQTIQVAGTKFETGIGILANSKMEVRIDSEFSVFSAKVGVDDNTRNLDDSVVFEIYGDGKLLVNSPPMKFGDSIKTLSADIQGVKIVELIARQKDARRLPATVAWAEAALLRD